jgi:surface protein
MKPTSIIQRLVILLITLMSAIGANAQEAYACYTESNTTLTFYYDNLRSSRTGTTYSLNKDVMTPGWESDQTNRSVTQVVFDSSFADARPTTTNRWFNYMQKLESITGMEYLNTSEVTIMSYMFQNCTKLTSLDVSHFNTSKLIDMKYMFYNCSQLTVLDLSSFNTSKVAYMNSMFYDCYCLETIYVDTGWSTAKVTRSENMFAFCNNLVGGQGTEYASCWTDDATCAHIDGGTSNPGYFTDIYAPRPYACYTPSNKTLTFYYDTQRDSRTGTTYDLNTNGSNTGWDTDGTKSKVTKVVFKSSFAEARPRTTFMWFYNMENLQSITGLSYLNTSKVTDMAYMFTNCTKLTSLDVSHFNTSRVYEMFAMFSGCTSLTTLDLSSWETSQVYSLASMFSGCIGLTSLDLSSFNTAEVEHMDYMFSDCTNLKTIYVGNGWSTAEVMESASMFGNCTSLKGGKGTTYDANHVDATYARVDGGTSNPGYLTAVAKAYAIYTSENKTLTFYNDDQFAFRTGTIYDLNSDADYNDPDWRNDGTFGNVTQVVFAPSFADARPTTTYAWFYYMYNLQSITGLNYLNTSKVTNMAYMFMNCTKLTSLDLSSFNTSKVTDMGYMFENCRLKSLDLSSFNTSKVTNMSSMFEYCLNLRTIYVGSGWNTAAVTVSGYMFYNCHSLEGGQSTTYDESHVDKTYARIDGNGGPGYFTAAGTEPYACYQNGTLTFYYDNQRDSRTGTTYDLNTGARPEWLINGTNANVTKVVFDSSFVGARPTITSNWFNGMGNLIIIEGMNYLNTSEVTNMFGMFVNCEQLTKLDLSCFNTSKVSNMNLLFSGCKKLRTIYVGNGWSTAAVTQSTNMFSNCTILVGGQGTTWSSSNPIDKTYAHIDGEGGPGYFTARTTGIATDLHQVTSDKQQVQSNEWYTIDGRKLNGMPAKKGVYIQNGQKQIIK